MWDVLRLNKPRGKLLLDNRLLIHLVVALEARLGEQVTLSCLATASLPDLALSNSNLFLDSEHNGGGHADGLVRSAAGGCSHL